MAKKQYPLLEERDTFEPLKGVKSVLNALKNRVRASTDILMAAVDIGKFRNCACFMISNGKVLAGKYYFPNTAKGFEWFLNKVGFYKNRNHCRDIISGMEPSGQY